MVAPDEARAPMQTPEARKTDTQDSAHNGLENRADADALEEENWRGRVGQFAVDLQHTVDGNLSLFRLGCIAVMAGSAYAAVRLSGVLGRFNHVDDIPASFFRQRKMIHVRMVRQSEQDPNVFYVYHTPFLRRVLLQDTLPSNSLAMGDSQRLIAIRAFGIQVDESAQEWLWSNVVSPHRAMKLSLLHRMNAAGDGEESIASCIISIHKLPVDKDFAHELVSRGLAEYLPENLEKYASGSGDSVQPLLQRLRQLETAQKNAQKMQYGIWKEWQEENLTDRVMSAGKRVTSRGFQKLVSKVTGAE